MSGSAHARIFWELTGMVQVKIDLVLLQETNVADGIYVWESAGFHVVASDALSHYRGGVALFYKKSPRFAV